MTIIIPLQIEQDLTNNSSLYILVSSSSSLSFSLSFREQHIWLDFIRKVSFFTFLSLRSPTSARKRRILIYLVRFRLSVFRQLISPTFGPV